MVAVFLHYLFSFMIISRDFLLFETVENDRTVFFSHHTKAASRTTQPEHISAFQFMFTRLDDNFGIRIQPIMHINLHVFTASVRFLRIFCISLPISFALDLVIHVVNHVAIFKVNPMMCVLVFFWQNPWHKFIGGIECVFF